MLEEKITDISKTGQQAVGVAGPQKSILDFFKSPGKDVTKNQECSDHEPECSSLLLEIVEKQTFEKERFELNNSLNEDDELCVSKQNRKSSRKKKHKQCKISDASVEVIEDDTSLELQESIIDTPLSSLKKKKKCKKEKWKLDESLEEERILCGSADLDKAEDTENVFIQSQDRNCCAFSEVIKDVGDVSRSKKKKKHKHKKMKQDDADDVNNLTDNVFTAADDDADTNITDRPLSKHKNKKGKKRTSTSNEEVDDSDASDKIVNLLEEHSGNKKEHLKNEENDTCLTNIGIKRKLELEFESPDHSHPKHKKKKKNSESKELNEKTSDNKPVEISYHEYLQTLVSVDYCSNSDTSSEINTSKITEHGTTVNKTELKDDSKQKIQNTQSAEEKNVKDADVKSKEENIPSIAMFFSKKPEKKVTENHSTVTVQADVHQMPSVSKQSNQNKEISPQKLLQSSSPSVISISDDIVLLSSEKIKHLSSSNVKIKKKHTSTPRTKVKHIKSKVHVTASARIQNSKKKLNLKMDISEKKTQRKLETNSDPDLVVTELPENSVQQPSDSKLAGATDHEILQSQMEKSDEMDKGEKSVSKEKREAFLKNEEMIIIPAKTAQAKLCFSGSKLLSKTTGTDKVLHSTRLRNPTKKKINKSPKKTKLKKESKKSKLVKSNSLSVDSSPENIEPVGGNTQRKGTLADSGIADTAVITPQVSRYRVSSLHFDDDRKTPIKMKLRCFKISSGEESDFTQVSLKMAKDKKVEAKRVKAQELLHKAKRHKQKTKMLSPVKKKVKRNKKKKKHSREHSEDVMSSDESCRRRSERLAAHANQSLEETFIEIDDEDDVVVKKTSISKKSVKHQKSTKQKASEKLAPIFMKSGEEKQIEDPEKIRLRRAFLMSGIPDELRKQTVAPSVPDYPEFTPLPLISHIQQKNETLLKLVVDIWRLPCVSVSLRKVDSKVLSDCHWSRLEWKPLKSRKCRHIFQNFNRHNEISEDILGQLIEEMKTFNRNYPFAEMFKELQSKKQEDINSHNSEDQSSVPPIEVQAEIEPAPVEDNVSSKKKKHKKKHKSSIDVPVAAKVKQRNKNKLSLVKDRTEAEAVSSVTECTKPWLKELMWTDRYQPSHSSEVIGHSKNITKIKSWLLQWKHRTDLEERKMRKRLLQQTNGKSVNKEKESERWDGDDSEFDFSDESDSDDDKLCNTLLISGPSGIGKTATVYALAQEVGYKVIEVNASSSRNGKHILSQLQEATQSHQVAQSKDGTNMLNNTAQGMIKQSFQKNEDMPTQKLPAAFTNLFKKAAAKETVPIEIVDVDKTVKKHSKKSKKSKKKEQDDTSGNTKDIKRKRETDSQDGTDPKRAKKDYSDKKCFPSRSLEDSSQTGSLNLSSTTLILFDEVDIFFEDFDKGFLPAVQHFMNTAKIPIILTTTNSDFSHQLQSRVELITFKCPSLPDIASHLQTLCLVDSLRTDYHDIVSLVRFCHGDVRKCMLTLQFWLDSGGDFFKQKRPLQSSGNTVQNEILCESMTGDSQDTQAAQTDIVDEEESEFLRSSKYKPSRVIYDDDTNCNPFPVDMVTKDNGSNLPCTHKIRAERLLGALTTEAELEENVFHYLKGITEVESLNITVQNLKSSSIDVLYSNILHFLPLPKTQPCSCVATPSQSTASSKRFWRIDTDVFDNDESLDSVHEIEDKTALEQNPDKMTKHKKLLNLKSLNNFSMFYDTMSFVDILEAAGLNCDLDKPVITDSSRGHLSSGTSVSLIQQEYSQWYCQSLRQDILSELELRNARTFYNCTNSNLTEYKIVSKREEIPDCVHIPVENGVSNFCLQESNGQRMNNASRKARENVALALPLCNYCHPQALSLDYLPALRTIVTVEQLRQVAKAKRRFHHYFDHIGLTLKESTLNSLLSTL